MKPAGLASAGLLWVLAAACASERTRDLQPGSGVHAPGVLETRSPAFHGRLVAENGWDLERCSDCHGGDFAGGSSGKSCLTCHSEGPTSCTTCHGQLAQLGGAHALHLAGGALGRRFSCAECHVVPERWDAPGHLRSALGIGDPAPAEVRLSILAGATASWNTSSQTCQNVACHGARRVEWRAGAGAPCGSCHDLPPPGHADDRCQVCHSGAGDNPRSPEHVDGVVQVGHGGTDCMGCHGSGISAAPPRDLMGRIETAALGVGAHAAHVAAERLRGPVACADCHRVPDRIDSPGHIDSAGPAEVVFAGVAVARSAQPSWQRQSATCAGVYCHGAASPSWTRVGQGEAACGSCHGVPPLDASHAPGLVLSDCASCHPRTVDAAGNILVTSTGAPGARTSEHIDGNVDTF